MSVELMRVHDHDESGWSPQGAVVEISDAASWELLAASTLGRLGVSSGGLPGIYPVNFVSDGGSILFRTANGEKLERLRENENVVFEVDGEQDRGAWSVVVTGIAEILSGEPLVPESGLASLPPWAPIESYVVVRIRPSAIRGRHWEPHHAIERD
ncbi:MAG: pyridoxamine 5'-phosphate oxidase family protein [Actinomycetota bacterium]|nr:pyridoxamine 5'-phosphate oxidase family protein [Actinomycetota bacterium]